MEEVVRQESELFSGDICETCPRYVECAALDSWMLHEQYTICHEDGNCSRFKTQEEWIISLFGEKEESAI